MSDWQTHVSPLQMLNAILRFLGRLVPRDDRYKTNLLFDAVAILGCLAVFYEVPAVSQDKNSVIYMFLFVVVASGICVLTSFILTRPWR